MVVEGADDLRFWSARKHAECELIDGEGKPNVVRSVQLLDADNFCGVLGVLDDDYDSLLGIQQDSRNLVTTDSHDLECLLCRSSALDRVLAEFGSPSRISRFEKNQGVDVRSGLLERAMVFGRLRWAAARFSLSISSSEINVPRFVDSQTWAVDCKGLTRVVLRSDSSEDESVLTRCISQLPPADPWRVARGHDMIQILRIGLKKVLGNIRSSVGSEQISSVLRASIPSNELEVTKLWSEIRTWEKNNIPYSILPH